MADGPIKGGAAGRTPHDAAGAGAGDAAVGAGKPGEEAPPPAAHNRRRWPRIPLHLEVHAHFASVTEAVESRTVDVSRGGVFLQMRDPRPMGTHVVLDMKIGDGRAIRVGGVVVRQVQPDDRSGPPGVAVVFTDVDDDAARLLDELLDQKLGRAPKR